MASRRTHGATAASSLPPSIYSGNSARPPPLAGAFQDRAQDFGVEGIAADAEILVGPAGGRRRPRPRDEGVDAPATGDAHALGMAHRDRLEGGLADERFQDRDKRLLDEVADRQLGLDAAGIDGAIGLDRDLR